jgi:hypothetical protein
MSSGIQASGVFSSTTKAEEELVAGLDRRKSNMAQICPTLEI